MQYRAYLFLIVAVLAGCGSPKAADFEPAGAAASNPATTTSAAIAAHGPDAAELSAAIAKLESVRAQVRRDVLATRAYTPDDDKRLAAIFTGEALDFQRGVWQDAAIFGAPELKTNPADASYPITEIVKTTSDCAWFRSRPTDDYVTSPPQIAIDIVLQRQSHDESVNPTPWVAAEFRPVGALVPGTVCR